MQRLFFLVQTVDRSKHYAPENKIVIDVKAGVNIFGNGVDILQHVKNLAAELSNDWNKRYLDAPQLQSTRSHYQDQMVLTSHNFPVRKAALNNRRGAAGGSKTAETSEALGLTNLLLIVNNWSFVRDTQHLAAAKTCKPGDFQVQLKLASTAFRTALNPDCEFAFDKQSANFPLESFEELLASPGLARFMREIKTLCREEEGLILEDDSEYESDSTELEDEEPAVADREESKKRRKRRPEVKWDAKRWSPDQI